MICKCSNYTIFASDAKNLRLQDINYCKRSNSNNTFTYEITYADNQAQWRREQRRQRHLLPTKINRARVSSNRLIGKDEFSTADYIANNK